MYAAIIRYLQYNLGEDYEVDMHLNYTNEFGKYKFNVLSKFQ